jgi:hypothetical protein
MSIEITIDEKYAGPGILELISVIPDIADKTVKLRWTNSKDEVHALKQFDRNFALVVPDAYTFDRTVTTFGKRLKISAGIVERAKFVLTDKKGYDWRHFVEELHDVSPRYLLLKLAADAIRKGIQPSLAEIAGKVFIEGISPADVDVLVRLRAPRMRG